MAYYMVTFFYFIISMFVLVHCITVESAAVGVAAGAGEDEDYKVSLCLLTTWDHALQDEPAIEVKIEGMVENLKDLLKREAILVKGGVSIEEYRKDLIR